MSVHLADEGLSYFSVPKCGCTSLKLMFFRLLHGLTFEQASEQGHPATRVAGHIHEVFPSQPFGVTRAQSGEGWTRLAVVRDPVSRIASCYANKVFQNNGLLWPGIREAVEAAGLSLEPDFDTFVTDLDAYRAASPDIAHHSEPLSHFLGTDPAYFTRIFPLNDVNGFVDFLGACLGRDVPPLSREQQSVSWSVLSEVDPDTTRRIETRFAEDIALFGDHF